MNQNVVVRLRITHKNSKYFSISELLAADA